MVYQSIHEYIQHCLDSGHAEPAIEKALVSKGWSKVDASRAILDAKFGTQDNVHDVRKELKVMNKKLQINIGVTGVMLIFALVVVLFNGQPAPLPLPEELPVAPSFERGKPVEKPQGPSEGEREWCRYGQKFSDSLVEDGVIIQGIVEIEGDEEIYCHAATEEFPELGYLFSEDQSTLYRYDYQSDTDAEDEGEQEIVRILIRG